ncbi:MAG: helix-turn-helix domain-containing protein [Actinomycetota bacterium]|nr:helix-turn-helix domain-containing protein [Actinomycetota bacterium]
MVSAAPEPFDSIAKTLELVGDRWTMLVLRDVFRGLHRFEELRADLGIARPVLSDRLGKLVDGGILARVPYEEHPPRHEYRLTEMGLELSPALVALMRWGDRWLAGTKASVVLYHGACGTELEQGFWCPTCATTFGPRAIKSRLDPPRTRRAATRSPATRP